MQPVCTDVACCTLRCIECTLAICSLAILGTLSKESAVDVEGNFTGRMVDTSKRTSNIIEHLNLFFYVVSF